MSLFKLQILCFWSALLIGVTGFAQVGSSSAETKDITYPAYSRAVRLSYISWNEFVDLDRNGITDTAFANFYGNSLGFQKDFHSEKTWHWALEGVLASGLASAGGSQSKIAYQTSGQNWWAVMATIKMIYRLSGSVDFSLGPTVLYRQLKWPAETSNANVKSGADANVGALAGLRFRLAPNWELTQSFGSLALKASAIWALGVGYNF